MATSQKPQAQFRILLGGADGGTGSPLVKKVGQKVIRFNKSNTFTDLDAAIHSITSEGNATNTPQRGVLASPKVMNKPVEKMEKIVFMPKLVQQKKVPMARENLKSSTPKAGIVQRLGGKSGPIRIVQKMVTNTDGQSEATPKRRKLGDIALASWQDAKDSPKAKVEADPLEVSPFPALPAPSQPKLLCRLCGSAVADDDEVIDLMDAESGNVTPLALKLKAVVNGQLPENSNHPNVCCKLCGGKVNMCFTLLAELQASYHVARNTFGEADVEVNPMTQMYTCTDCEQEVLGMKAFVQHYESHYLEKTLGPEPTQESESTSSETETQDLVVEMRTALDEGLVLQGTTLMTEDGQYMCELCGKLFPYKIQLALHRKAPRRSQKVESVEEAEATDLESGQCYVCGQQKAGLNKCKLVGGEELDICADCRNNVTFMIM